MELVRTRWIGALVVVIALGLLAVAWKWTGLRAWVDPERIAAWVEPYRASWFALPLVVIVFVVAGFLLFPVLVLVFVCGLAFGPWLGSLYALAGSLASATAAFGVGRHLGRARLERWGGKLVKRVTSALDGRGVVAVFLVRKIPAPFTLVNLVCGASPVSLRDFVFGTLLGMGTGVLLITILGGQLLEILRRPDPRQIAVAAGLSAVTIAVTVYVQRVVNRRAEDAP